jgi:hypothetical protein
MTDNEMYKILEDFANSHTLARDIVVSINEHTTSFKPRFPAESFKHEDSECLSELLRGATHFMYWLRREGKARLVKSGITQTALRKKGKGGKHGRRTGQ